MTLSVALSAEAGCAGMGNSTWKCSVMSTLSSWTWFEEECWPETALQEKFASSHPVLETGRAEEHGVKRPASVLGLFNFPTDTAHPSTSAEGCSVGCFDSSSSLGPCWAFALYLLSPILLSLLSLLTSIPVPRTFWDYDLASGQHRSQKQTDPSPCSSLGVLLLKALGQRCSRCIPAPFCPLAAGGRGAGNKDFSSWKISCYDLLFTTGNGLSSTSGASLKPQSSRCSSQLDHAQEHTSSSLSSSPNAIGATSAFSVEPKSGTIAAGQGQVFQMKFSPMYVGNFESCVLCR